MLVTDALEMIPLSSKLRLHSRPAMVHSLRSTLKRSLFACSEASKPSVCSVSEEAGCLVKISVSEAMICVAAIFESTLRNFQYLNTVRLKQLTHYSNRHVFHDHYWLRIVMMHEPDKF